MDFQLRLDRGAVTSEAAIGIAAMVFVAAILIQSMLVGVQYIRLLGIVHVAAHIASASGDPQFRIAQAEQFLLRHQEQGDARITSGENSVTVSFAMQLPAVLSWKPVMQVSETANYLDEIAS